ncbi:MAG: hypothetical protein ACTHJV_00885 [Rhizobiaceae bacterium]
MFTPLKNPSDTAVKELLRGSKNGAVRRIHDERNGDFWYWDFDQATHAEGANILGIPYSRRPGEGDVVFL